MTTQPGKVAAIIAKWHAQKFIPPTELPRADVEVFAMPLDPVKAGRIRERVVTDPHQRCRFATEIERRQLTLRGKLGEQIQRGRVVDTIDRSIGCCGARRDLIPGRFHSDALGDFQCEGRGILGAIQHHHDACPILWKT